MYVSAFSIFRDILFVFTLSTICALAYQGKLINAYAYFYNVLVCMYASLRVPVCKAINVYDCGYQVD